MITFVTTSGNRLWQLQQTLPHNLKMLRSGESELLLLVYNDLDANHWVMRNFGSYLDRGLLILHNVSETPPTFLSGLDWSCGYVKHLAHRRATGDVLFNLDGDNFIDDGTHLGLIELPKRNLLVTSAETRVPGSYGRIGIHREDYELLGGYRDSGSGDDTDLILRAMQAGFDIIGNHCILKPVPNEQCSRRNL